MNYVESVEYLLSLGNEVLAMKLGLENIGKLLDALGKPHEKYFKVQVAGTNGKGSTCAFLEGICLAAGIKTGLFTSPHLISITERVRIDGRDISDADFARIATKIRETSENLVAEGELEAVPTFFEQVTAIGLYAFAEAGVELAILETGLGGRFDAITAARAEVAVITPIDYDHQDILGHTLAEIAAEKAAIIRPDSKAVIVSPQLREAADVIADVCEKNGIEPVSKFEAWVTGKEERGQLAVNYSTDGNLYTGVRPRLNGAHQVENLGVAILTAEVLGSQFPINAGNILTGAQRAVHHGRLEFVGNVLFDGAHNLAGAKALANFLDESVNGPITMIFGAMRDKDVGQIAEVLFPWAARVILTRPDNPRSLKSSHLRESVPAGIETYETDSVAEAISLARELTPKDEIICVTGSLYLVGEAMKLLNNR